MKKYWMIFKTEIGISTAYRAVGIVWMLFDIFLIVGFPFVLLNIAEHDALPGFDAKGIISYYVLLSIFTNLIWTHPETTVGENIKEGKLTNYLVKPQNYLTSIFLAELAWKLIRLTLFFPILVGIFVVAKHYLIIPSLSLIPWILLILPGAVIIFYLTGFLTGLTAFWTEEHAAATSIFWIVSGIFGGTFLPLALFPPWFIHIANWLPWRYAASIPIQVTLGAYHESDFLGILAGQFLWIVVLYAIYRLAWFFGIRRYTAIGR